MSQFVCPLCGKFSSVKHYDPSNYEEDIMLVQVRGLGHRKGVEVSERYSLLEGENQELLDLISDRIEILYNMLYEDDEPEEEEETEEFDFTPEDWEEI